MSLYKVSKGVQVKISPSEAKQTIMKANDWTESEYKKAYDVFKNKLRAYEALMEAETGKAEKQSPVELLYKQAKAKQYANKRGAGYTPSAKMKIISKMPAMSISKGKKAAKQKGYVERRKADIGKITDKQFGGLISKNEKAKEIAEAIKDPIRRAQALADYANQIRQAIDNRKAQIDAQAIPVGDVVGSPDLILDFDYSLYMDERQ